MMKKICYNLYLLCCLPLLLLSCETVVPLELPEPAPKLVVNATFNPDSLFTVDVSASHSTNTDGPHTPVTDASVQVYQAGQLLFNLQHIGDGMYKADQKPQPLQRYQLKVSAPGYPICEASSHVPLPPAISEVEAERAPPLFDGFNPTMNILFTLTDDPAQENYYCLEAFVVAFKSDGSKYKRNVSMKFIAPIESEFSMESRYFFSDKLIKGKAIPFKLNLDSDPDSGPNSEIFLRVAHITPEYYHYVRTLEKQSKRDNFVTTPQPVTNNISNGLGLFAGYNAVTL